MGISGPFDLVDLSDHFHSRGLDRRLLSSIFEVRTQQKPSTAEHACDVLSGCVPDLEAQGRLDDFSPTRLVTDRDLTLPPVLLGYRPVMQRSHRSPTSRVRLAEQ